MTQDPSFAPHRITDEILVAQHDGLGRLRLNRPRPINALTDTMCQAMIEQLSAWEEDDTITAVVLDGAGEKGLCAGGDVRAAREAIMAGEPERAMGFWEAEYDADMAIADYPKPFMALMDGIVMGGGLGVSAHGSIRLTTERSRIAMPETIIGFFPDVGMMHLLSRAPGELGTYLALTGASITGADAVAVGLADACVRSELLPQVVNDLAAGNLSGLGDLHHGHAEILGLRPWVDECFAGNSAADILEALQARHEPEAQQAAKDIEVRSPLSVAIALEAIRRAESMSLHEVFDQDLRLARRMAELDSDFAEGVRARLVDKDNMPVWGHASLEDVSRSEVLAYFE